MSSVSVVTNALRLRGFRRPASAEEILHPPLRRAGRRGRLPGRHRGRRARDRRPGHHLRPGRRAAPAWRWTTATQRARRRARRAGPDDRDRNHRPMRFSPDAVTVREGETIAFVVTQRRRSARTSSSSATRRCRRSTSQEMTENEDAMDGRPRRRALRRRRPARRDGDPRLHLRRTRRPALRLPRRRPLPGRDGRARSRSSPPRRACRGTPLCARLSTAMFAIGKRRPSPATPR